MIAARRGPQAFGCRTSGGPGRPPPLATGATSPGPACSPRSPLAGCGTSSTGPRADGPDGRHHRDLGTPEELLDAEESRRRGGIDPREALEPIIQEAAALHGVDPDLVKAVIQTDRASTPARSPASGAKGLMQLMPRTAKAVGIEDPFDARQNIFGGVKYLSQMMQRYDGNTALALAAYNAGPGNVRRHRGVPPFRETRGYVSKIAKLVADSDAAFSVPVYRAPAKKARVASRSARKAGVKKASMASRAKARKATVTRARTARRSRPAASPPSAPTPAARQPHLPAAFGRAPLRGRRSWSSAP